MGGTMNQKQDIGNALWLMCFCAALTSPFWGHWTFGLGVVLMAVASELRKDVPGPRRGSSMRSGPRLATRNATPLMDPQREEAL